MNGPLLLFRASARLALFGLVLYTKLLGPKRAKRLFWGGMVASALVAVALQLSGR